MTGKSDRSLWAVSQKTPCCLAGRRKEIPAAAAAEREPRVLCRGSSLQPPHGCTDPPTLAPRCSSHCWVGCSAPALGIHRMKLEGDSCLSVEVPHPLWGGLLQVPALRLTHSWLGFVVWTSLENKSSFWGSPAPPRGLFPGCLSHQPQGDTVGIGWERVPGWRSSSFSGAMGLPVLGVTASAGEESCVWEHGQLGEPA